MSVIDPQETCAALKKEVFVPLLKRDTVLSVVLKARAHRRTQHNVSKAARLASIDRNYLYRMIKKHGIARKE